MNPSKEVVEIFAYIVLFCSPIVAFFLFFNWRKILKRLWKGD